MDPQLMQAIAGQLAERRLSTRDRMLRERMQMSPQETAMDQHDEMKLGNLRALLGEIAGTRDPRKKAVLEQELQRIMQQGAAMLDGQSGPPPLLPAQPMSGAYDPQDQMQKPDIARGWTFPQNGMGKQPLPFPRSTY